MRTAKLNKCKPSPATRNTFICLNGDTARASRGTIFYYKLLLVHSLLSFGSNKVLVHHFSNKFTLKKWNETGFRFFTYSLFSSLDIFEDIFKFVSVHMSCNSNHVSLKFIQFLIHHVFSVSGLWWIWKSYRTVCSRWCSIQENMFESSSPFITINQIRIGSRFSLGVKICLPFCEMLVDTKNFGDGWNDWWMFILTVWEWSFWSMFNSTLPNH